MKSFSVGGVFLLLFVFSLEVMYCEGCLKQERAALIDMSFRLGNSLAWTRNIFDDYYDVNKIDADCCEWSGVECNTTTGRVTKLKLMPSPEDQDFIDPIPQIGPWQPNYSDFVIFKDLKTLDLSGSGISDCTTTNQGLNNLEVLDLNLNNFKNALGILSCLDGLSSLKSLSLAGSADDTSYLHIFQTVLETISLKLLHLELLDISAKNLSNEILPSLRGFTSLKELYLSNIGLDTDLHFQGLCASLKNLEILHLSNSDEYLYNIPKNNFSDTDIASALSGLSSLKSLNLAGSEITLRSIHNISKLRSLEILDLSHNNFNDTDIASALSGLSSLKSLNLQESKITLGSIHNISKLKRLEILDLSSNYMDSLPLENHGFAWPSSLQNLSLSFNRLSNNIISSLNGLPNLRSLDLSRNNLNGSLDISGLSTLASLKSLSFSNNHLVDLVVHKENHGFRFAWPSSLQVLSLSYNSLSNNIISSLSGLPHLKSLDLSYNNLNGSLDITGLSTLTSLKILDFNENQLIDLVVHKGSKNLSRLDILYLDSNMINGSNLQEWLWAFPSIRNLTLRYNEFKGTILDGGFRGLRNLEYLVLDGSSNLQNEFFKSIGDLPSLKVLSVQDCGMNGTLPIGDWYKLKKLEELDLSGNEFVGKFPSSFFNMTSLRTLKLTDNHFIGNIAPNLASSTSLEYLDFEGNQFEFPISLTQFYNHSNLKFIFGNGNKVILDSHPNMNTWVPKFQLQVLQLSSITEASSIPLPNFLLYQYNLFYVDFTGCKLSGYFPNWLLENNTKMEHLVLEGCSFVGNFQLPSRPYLDMVKIDVSNNAITGKMWSNNISSIFPNLIHLNMSGNAIHGSIPYELSQLSSLHTLDLSDNQLYGEIPYGFFGDGSKLSSLQDLLLYGNNLSGNIPSNLFNLSSIVGLDVSYNNFIGKIPSQKINSPLMHELSMSNNQFEGSIPSELAEVGISFLDLSQNNLTGCVPSFPGIISIHLSNNKLSCLSNMMDMSFLVTLDLSNNEITNGFHGLIHDLSNTELKILLLKRNHFMGNIPNQLCRLTKLDILDLSFNNFVGEIPSCLGKMPFENLDPSWDEFNEYSASRGYTYQRFRKEEANFTSKKRSETYTTSILIYMSGIDLSHNKLNGSIPIHIGNLTRIRALNLSNNFLTGKIPATFSNLVQVESLDLSFNMLSGRIPPQLSGLTSLEVFSVAHNNLSGATPERKGQFITFDESSYEGNQFLCGPPLTKSCNPSGQAPATLPNGLKKDGENESWVDMYVFRVSFVVAYTSILLVIPIVLYINPYWRQAWFYYIRLVCMNCYYFIEDNLYKFF